MRDSLNARSTRQRAYTTVLSVLSRLHDKGLLHRRRSGRADIYTPTLTLTEAEYRLRRAGAEVGELVTHFGDDALAHFVQAVDTLDDERMADLTPPCRRSAG